MKKSFFAFTLAVVISFLAAVGLCFRALVGAQAVSAFDTGMKVVVDAGHGGIDGGVVGRATGVKESDLNLAIAFRLKSELTDMGFEVVMTRKTQAGLYDTTAKGFKKRDMQKRKEIIENADPDLVISLHQNYYPSQKTRGGQVFYSKEQETGKALALAVQEKVNGLYAGEGVKSRKATAEEYFILQCSDCPSIIVECGFLSNAADEKLLMTERWQGEIARSVAAGVVAFLSGGSA